MKLGFEMVHVQKNGVQREGRSKEEGNVVGWTRDGKELMEKEEK
jgi:hypothetical protein